MKGEEYTIVHSIKTKQFLTNFYNLRMNQKIWDCASFYCEVDLLELRLKHLWDWVDHFVISEADRTHQNRPRKFLLPELLEGDLSWAKSKVIPILVEIDPDNLPDTKYNSGDVIPLGDTVNNINWKIENYQRNSALRAIGDVNPDDIILIGDLDEFPHADCLSKLRILADHNNVLSLGMQICSYWANNRKVDTGSGNLEYWAGTVIGKRKFLEKPQNWRDNREIVPWLPDMGYHFSWLKKSLSEKLNSTAHSEIKEFYTEDDILNMVESNSDFLGRKFHLFNPYVDPNFPRTILDNIEKYPHLINTNY
jgi:beta-1,4-mannosyl-glycoprotein beta-1,4-N-acetylglucosaminyltransferase